MTFDRYTVIIDHVTIKVQVGLLRGFLNRPQTFLSLLNIPPVLMFLIIETKFCVTPLYPFKYFFVLGHKECDLPAYMPQMWSSLTASHRFCATLLT